MTDGPNVTFYDIRKEYLQGYLSTIPDRFKGAYKEWPQRLQYVYPRGYVGQAATNICHEAQLLKLNSNDEYHIVKEWAKQMLRQPKYVSKNV